VKHEDVKHEEGDVAASALSFAEWELCVPASIKGDTLWLVEAYRLSLYLGDLGWFDSRSLMAKPGMRFVADQLGRATAKISACIAEGYSRNTGKGRAIYYEYALGSDRESRDWYYKARMSLQPEVIQNRLSLCTQIIRLSLTMVATERRNNRRAGGSA
jgi:four helix bundle protein